MDELIFKNKIIIRVITVVVVVRELIVVEYKLHIT